MGLELNISLSENSDCNKATFCDTTCMTNYYDKFTCCDGYGVDENISRKDISYTRFDWVFPNGNNFDDVNMFWQPGTTSEGYFNVDGGTNGVVVVDVDGLIIGQQVFITDIQTTINALVQNINTIAAQTGWQSYTNPSNSSQVIIESIMLGDEYNGKTINVSVSGDISIGSNVLITEGANGNGDCICFDLNAIYEQQPSLEVPCSFTDGVYNLIYKIYDSNDVELGRATGNFLFSCQLECAIKKLILLPSENKCSCQDGFDDKLVELRLMLEKAKIQFDDCLYDCANETMKNGLKMAYGICLDC